MASFKKTLTFLISITLIGAFLRFYRLSDFPPSLNWDEVSHAYNAYSLYHTGRDQWGQILPLFNFRAYGDYPTSLNLYLTVPVIALLGPSDLAARIPQALLGILTILTAFLAGYYWQKKALTGLITAALVAFEPWTFFTSRQVLQANGAILLLFLGAALYYKSKTAPQYRLKTLLFFGFSLLAYHNTRLFVPLFAAGLWLVGLSFRKNLGWLVLVVVGGLVLLNPASRTRSVWVGILDSGSLAFLNNARNTSSWPPLITRLVYNRPVYFFSKTLTNYLGYLSPGFLFIHGGTQYQYSLPKWGVMQVADLPFFYLGIVGALSSAPMLIWWIITSPLPAAMTVDKFAVVRATTMIPAVYLLTASGLTRSWKRFGRWYCLAFLVFTTIYLSKYFGSYPIQYSSSWQYGYRQAVDFIKVNYDQYNEIIFTKKYGEPHEFVAYYWPWDPTSFQKNSVWDYHANWYWVNKLDKIKFVNDWEMKSVVLKPKTLIISSPENETTGNEIKKVNFLDGKTAFIIKEQP